MNAYQIARAKSFQLNNNLDLTDIPNLLKHDYIHITLNLGVTKEEEELVEQIELFLDQKAQWLPAEIKALACSLPKSFLKLYE